MFVSLVYRGLPSSLLFVLTAFLQYHAIRAFV